MILAPEAEADIEDILLYGHARWGADQANDYVEAIRASLRQLSDFPEIGQARPELFPGARSRLVGQHHIFYYLRGRTVNVVRILHARMEAARHLAGELGDQT